MQDTQCRSEYRSHCAAGGVNAPEIGGEAARPGELVPVAADHIDVVHVALHLVLELHLRHGGGQGHSAGCRRTNGL